MSSGEPAIVIRNTDPDDYDGIRELTRRVYPDMAPWREPALAAHRERFPEGQFVAVETASGRVVGMAATLILSWSEYDRTDSYRDFVGTGKFETHDPEGRTMYGAEVMVDPALQGHGIGKSLYRARRELCRAMKLPRIRAGGRIPNYHLHAERLTAQQYVIEVVNKRLYDPTLGFQLSQGFHVFGVVADYIKAPQSHDYASLIEWINDEVATADDIAHRDPRFAAPPGLWPASD